MKFERKKSLKQRASEAPVKLRVRPPKKKRQAVVIEKQSVWERFVNWLNTDLWRF